MPKFRENMPLAKFANYRIGGSARFFFEAKTEEDVRWAVREAAENNLPVFVLGGGTNLLLDDRGIRGLVLKIGISGISAKGRLLSAGAGTSMDRLAVFAAKHSLAGLEWAGGLPGTLGGAVRGNAGCFGGEIKDAIRSVRSVRIATGRIIIRSAKKCRFGYRDSVFKRRPGEIIIGATFRMRPGASRELSAKLRMERKWRAEHHPLEYPSAGSVFKNVPLARIAKPGSPRYRRALKDGAITYRGSRFSVKTDPAPVIAAAKLIGESGLQGARRGGALVSPKHTNFVVNAGGATAKDVRGLIARIKATVHRKFGITLEEEIQVVSW